MANNKNQTTITNISITAVVLGLISLLTPLFANTPDSGLFKALTIIKELSPNFFEQNFLNLFFYFLLLLGVILYLKSNGKEIRLLRFSFSILLIIKALLIFRFIPTIIFFRELLQEESSYITMNVLSFLMDIAWLWASYVVMKIFAKNVSLQLSITSDFVNSPKLHRFLHHIIDLILSIAIFSTFLILLLGQYFGQIEHFLGETLTMYLVIIISRLLYFVIYEFGFGATPAKFFTGSRIIMKREEAVSLKTVVFRSLIRHVPFEPLSYLGKGNGWHDRWTNTRIVKEENPGMPFKKYLWLIVPFVVIAIIRYFRYLG
jgi:hypothetical protein